MSARLDEAAWEASAHPSVEVPALLFEHLSAPPPVVEVAPHPVAHAVPRRRWAGAWVLVAAVAVAVLVGVLSS